MSVAIRYSAIATRRRILAGDEPEWLRIHPRRSYVRQAYLSRPEWVDQSEMRWLDWCRRSWSAVLGVEMVLAHIVPLNHPKVCGLLVPWNFELKTRGANGAEGNAWTCDSNACEQLKLEGI